MGLDIWFVGTLSGFLFSGEDVMCKDKADVALNAMSRKLLIKNLPRGK